MLKRLLGKSPVEVWVIKQVDPDLIHLCGQGALESRGNRRAVLDALARGAYRGGVRMAGGGLGLFEALVPLDDLTLTDDGQARWQDRLWRVSQVPQRSWSFEGSLVAKEVSPVGGSGLISAEDVSGIRQRVDRDTPKAPGPVTFRPDNELEAHPLPSRDPKPRR